MPPLALLFSNLAATQGYGIKDGDLGKLSDDFIGETLIQIDKLEFEINEKDKVVEAIQLV